MRCVACNDAMYPETETVFDELLELCNKCYFSYTEAKEDMDIIDEEDYFDGHSE